jgi:hypothetical protein
VTQNLSQPSSNTAPWLLTRSVRRRAASFKRRCGKSRGSRRCRAVPRASVRVQFDRWWRSSRPTASKTANFSGRFKGWRPVRPSASTGFMERAMGIEPTSEAWEASILPLYDARSSSKRNDSITLRNCLKLLLVAIGRNPELFEWNLADDQGSSVRSSKTQSQQRSSPPHTGHSSKSQLGT